MGSEYCARPPDDDAHGHVTRSMARDEAGEQHPEDSDRATPEPVGPYRILEVLGEGGMGVVYRAHQSAPLEREVALKVLKVGMNTRVFIERFESERRALAVMEHPGIAAVYDAGTTEGGRPYFVMELVRGDPLLKYCDGRRLTLRARATLFVRICHAVQHAHQKGIIHRDLKPSNIIVSEGAEGPLPKIIDFGIAKAMDTGAGGDVTRAGEVLGTPAYMSPEQAGLADQDVDTRADIYSLGMILYELVSGALPFDRESYRKWPSFASIMVRDPPTPRRRFATLAERDRIAGLRGVDAARLERSLGDDLQWIVMKAIERDRERRYATAADLAAEVGRYLGSRPIEARPPSRSYRLRRFVRRYPAAVGLGTALAAALIGIAVVQSVLRTQVSLARDQAVAARDDAEGILDFMISDLYAQLEPIGQLPVLLSVGEAAMEYFSRRPLEEFTDGELDSRSRALYQLGQVQMEQGRLDQAQTAFEESLRLAAALSERTPADSDRLFARGQSEFWVAELARRRGDLETAARHFERYRDISIELVGRDSANLTWKLERGYSHTNMGVVLRGLRRNTAALSEFQNALDVKRAVVTGEPSLRQSLDVAAALGWIALTLRDLGRLEDASRTADDQLAIFDALEAGAPPAATFAHAVALNRRSALEIDLGRPDSAYAFAARQRSLMVRLRDSDPTNVRWQREAAAAQAMLGAARLAAGDAAGAEGHLTAALRAHRSIGEASPDLAANVRDLEGTNRRLAAALVRLGDLDGSRSALARAEEAAALGDEADPFDVERVLIRAEIDAAEGRDGDAALARAEALGRARAAASDEDYPSRLLLAQALWASGEREEARRLTDELISAGCRHPDLVRWLGSG